MYVDVSVFNVVSPPLKSVFNCGAVDRARLDAVVLQSEEISEHRLEPLPTALTMLRGPIRRRVKAACRAKGLVYLEDGRRVPGVAS